MTQNSIACSTCGEAPVTKRIYRQVTVRSVIGVFHSVLSSALRISYFFVIFWGCVAFGGGIATKVLRIDLESTRSFFFFFWHPRTACPRELLTVSLGLFIRSACEDQGSQANKKQIFFPKIATYRLWAHTMRHKTKGSQKGPGYFGGEERKDLKQNKYSAIPITMESISFLFLLSKVGKVKVRRVQQAS